MKKIPSKFLCLMLAGLILLSILAPLAEAANDGNTISVHTAEDLISLAQSCTLDSWSRGKTVRLEADIDLSSVDFTPIPTFGGTFEGGGHTISGLSLTDSGNVRGLFRYIQSTGVVRNLTIEGCINPSGQKDALGGLAGNNSGVVTNVSFVGSVSGTNYIGGLVGVNEAAGQLINCSFSGTVTGEHYVGGIIGQNHGSVIQCENHGSVNTTEVNAEVSLDDLSRQQPNTTENVPICTDIGGIAGFSSGILQNCTNDGAVGCAHMGYNIGGIVGRQSGYLNGCSNSGTILGRKDVGGIAGQVEPEVRLLYSEGKLSDLLDELDVLRDLIDQTGDDLRDSSHAISDRMETISTHAGQAQDAIGDFSDLATDWAQDNINEINDLSARMSWLLDELSPLLDDTTDVTDLFEALTDQLNNAMDEAQSAGELGDEAADALDSAMDEFRAAAAHGEDAIGHLKTAWTHLQNALGETDATDAAVKELQDAVADFASAWAEISDSLSKMEQILQQAGGALQQTEEWQALITSLGELQEACAALPKCIKAVGDALANLIQTGTDDEAALAALQAAVQELLAAGQNFAEAGMELAQALIAFSQGDPTADLDSAYQNLQTAYTTLLAAQQKVATALAAAADPDTLAALQAALAELDVAITNAQQALEKTEQALAALEATDEAQSVATALQTQLDAIRTNLNASKQAVQEIRVAMENLILSSIDAAELEAARKQAQQAGEDLSAAVRKIRQGLDSSSSAVRRLRGLFDQAADVGTLLRDAGDTVAEIAGSISDLSASFADTIRELSEKPSITVHPISSELEEKRDALGDIFSDLLDDGDSLREAMDNTTDTLLDDLEAVSDQFGVITDRLRDLLDGDDEYDTDRFEDISDQSAETTDTGTVNSVRNTGTVEGDINTAGIVGSMAIEYDFDPEDDLVEEGSRSLDFRYQARTVVRAAVNTGTVTGKQDYAGGIVGRMDLGLVSGCENYGTVSSTNGDYTGGVAGASWGTIRDSWSKCHLSGDNYVGGIAGLGSSVVNCHALATIDQGTSYLGALAGDMEPDGDCSDNTFTSDSLGAIDGISYTGKAEPVDFDTLCTTAGVPSLFSQLELTFVADGETVEVIPFQYGAGINALPSIPSKKGYSAAWPDLDYSCLTASQRVEAVYTPYSSALTDDGDLPQILVDGSFGARATINHTSEETSWEDEKGDVHNGTAYTVTVTDPDLEQISYTVHYRLPDIGKRYALWIKNAETWQPANYTVDGQYLLLDSDNDTVTFCVTERRGGIIYVLLAVAAVVTVLSVSGYCIILKRKKRRR